MKCLLLAALMMAAVACATPHFETLFSINLPVAPAKGGSNYVYDSTFYVATKTGITAADLSTKSILWNGNVSGKLDAIYRHGDKVVAFSYPFAVVALDAATGVQAWSVSVFDLDPVLNFTGRGEEIAMVTPSKVTILNASTGAVVRTTTCEALHVSSWGSGPAFGSSLLRHSLPTESADPTVYCLVSGASGRNVKAVKLFSGAAVWTSSVIVKHLNWVFSGRYLILSNHTGGGDSKADLTVLDATTGALKVEVRDIPQGMSTENVDPTLSGSALTIVAGNIFSPRQLVIDLDSGVVTSNTAYKGSTIFGGNKVYAQDIDTEIQVSSSLKIIAQPAGSPSTTVANFVPSAANFNLQYYGQGVLQVGNLQGWTMWFINGTNPAMTIARDEMSPDWTPSIAKYDGAYIFVIGDTIRAEKFVM